MLFENKNRSYSGPASFLEDKYSFYDRTSNPRFAAVREMLNEWYSVFPDTEKRIIEKRIKSEFSEVFYELFLNEIFRRLGYSTFVHPQMPESNKTPDFLFKNGEVEFFLEAKLAIETDDTIKIRDIESRIYQGIREIKNPNFFISIDSIELEGEGYPSIKKFTHFLNEEIANINPDVLHTLTEPWQELEYSDKAISIKLRVSARTNKSRANAKALEIGSTPIKTRMGNSVETFKKAILKKSGRYGTFNQPMIVAVNFISNWGLYQNEIIQSLFGTEKISISLRGYDPFYFRERNGVFMGPQGPQCTRISCVIVSSVNPVNLENPYFTVFHNPFSNNPLCKDLIPFNQYYLNGNTLEYKEGKKIGEILNND